MPQTNLSHTALKSKQRAIRENFPEDLSLRVHRALSWYERAEQTKDDDDAKFIFLWIAFNAAYASEINTPETTYVDKLGERSVFEKFFDKLIAADTENRIYEEIWEQFSGPIRILMKNKYIFSPFWKNKNGQKGYEDWEKRLSKSSNVLHNALEQEKTATVLSLVFDRLYFLRNQIIHGGATYKSSANREQLKDAVAILGFLAPVFIDLMMDRPHEDWGKPYFPVVK